ncbi:ATP-binding protein [Sporanaerobium hydrogeniformans]|uniref:ATP-binding protein n=1 Tax=Sporanaerobium hydrogeniformans TaxID=3072179 RepID=UPI0015D4F2E7|nr:DUF815 domain-containing protein [Sporanaerobium hydrogeniformans]
MSFLFYTGFNNNTIIQNVEQLIMKREETLYTKTLSLLLEESYKWDLVGNIFESYLVYCIATSENPFSLWAEKKGAQMDEQVLDLARGDLEKLCYLYKHQPFKEEIKGNKTKNLEVLEKLLETVTDSKMCIRQLAEYYHFYGAGKMNGYKAFKWNEKAGFIGISECDPIMLDELIGCEYQKEALIKNTENFLAGKVANNVLLFGDSGTGKSSLVKALLNTYVEKGLRMIDLSKADFFHFNSISNELRKRGLKFIIFLDDLSFEEFETEYKYMKALIEGGVEIKPNNVLIYATSNRRHLIRETWDERVGQDVHIKDTRQEKLSLSERFGMTLTFTSPDQKAYLTIVEDLAQKHGIVLPENVLREKAIQWELVHGGRSGRVAKQFILSLL